MTRAVFHQTATFEDGDPVGPLGRAEAMGDDDAGSPGEETLGRCNHLVLGDGVHPGRRFVEHDHLHVADEQAGERHELRFARGQRESGRSEQRVQPVGQARDPIGETQLGNCIEDALTRHICEEGDVLCE